MRGAWKLVTSKMAASWLSCCRTSIFRHSSLKTSLEILYKRPQRWQVTAQTRRSIFIASNLRREETNIEDNPYYDKYSEKIKAAQQINKLLEYSRAGLADLESAEDKRPFQDKLNVDKRVLEEADRFKEKIKNSPQKATTINTRSNSGTEPEYGTKSLDDVLHMDLISELSAEEIGKLWNKYHKDKDCVSAVIPAHVFKMMEQKSVSYPLDDIGLRFELFASQFLYPLPRDSGYEFIYSEFSGQHCYLTSLLNYQTMAENAPWFLALTHFTDLADSKGIVLMVGEVDTKQLSVVDAQWLAYQVQMYYASNDPEREKLLSMFNNEPDKFDHMAVIEQLDNAIQTGALTPDDEPTNK